MTQFHHKVQEEKSYRRAIFLAVSLALAGHQGKGQTQQQGRASGAKGGGRRGMGSLPSPAYSPSLALPSSDISRPESSPPTTSFFDEAFWPAREFPSQVSARGGERDVSNEWQSPLPGRQRLRPGSGSGSPPSPPRSPPAETVPSQLLGGRAGTNAHLLNGDSPQDGNDILLALPAAESPQSPMSFGSTASYHTARRASAVAQLQSLLSPEWPVKSKLQSMPEQQRKKADSPPKTPGSKSSSRSKASKTSTTSKISNASSVAYFLRNRSDMRLFHKKSMPIAHTKKRPPKPTRVTMPLRSPSYYKPRVILDTLESKTAPPADPAEQRATPLTASEFIKVAGPSTLKLQAPSPRSDPPAITKPIRQMRSSDHAHSSDSTLHLTPPQIHPLTKRATWTGKQITTDGTTAPTSRPAMLRFSSTKRPALEARGSTKPSTMRPKHISLPGPVLVTAEALPEGKHYHDITPPEADPKSPFRAPLRHGDHYFRTFGNNTVYMKSFTPTMITTTPQKQQSSGSTTPLALPPSAEHMPSDHNTADQRKRKRSSIFNVFRRTAVNDGVIEGPRSNKAGVWPPQSPPTPLISISPPFESVKRRRSELTSSEMSLPPYFARPARSPSSSLATLSPVSPMTVPASPGPRRAFAARRSWSQRSSGDSPVSPGTQPRLRRPRLRHQATLADIVDADMPAVTAHGDVSPVVSPKSGAGMQSQIKSPKSEADLQAAPRGPGAIQWQSTAEKHVSTLPAEPLEVDMQDKRGSTFKQFFKDLHHSTSAGKLDMDAESPRAPTVGRRISLLPHSSMATLLARGSKPSLDKLKLKSSQGTISSSKRTERWERPELRVTNFYQTPYSQRVANNRRAELTHINALVEEALHDDEEDDTIMGFELNVPDHLPSSPLCPLSPKHKSGGKAICPMHGRKKKVRTAAGTRSRASVAPRLGPRIVYEGAVERTESGQSIVRIQEAGDGGKSPERLGSSHEAWYMC
ncbi:hypothetical protein LTR17_013318 [Elasticomyces elasticus]|nr:hypothetical protein LTR17_013318 [Elasticomyces elasticus]